MLSTLFPPGDLYPNPIMLSILFPPGVVVLLAVAVVADDVARINEWLTAAAMPNMNELNVSIFAGRMLAFMDDGWTCITCMHIHFPFIDHDNISRGWTCITCTHIHLYISHTYIDHDIISHAVAPAAVFSTTTICTEPLIQNRDKLA